MIYKQRIEIPSYLCDIDDRLHTWAAVRLCQEVTEYHGNATGIGFKTLLEQNRAWVIVRGLYNIYRLPSAFEQVELSTWSRGNNGLIAFRDYRMTGADGEVLLTGTSHWPLIDMTTRRALRLHDVIANYENHDILATEHSTIDKIVLPEMNAEHLVAQHTAAFSMVDHTRHVNNSEYIKLMFDTLHNVGFDTSQSFCLELNYQLETRPDEQLSIYHRANGDVHYLRIDNPRAVSVTARVTTTKAVQ